MGLGIIDVLDVHAARAQSAGLGQGFEVAAGHGLGEQQGGIDQGHVHAGVGDVRLGPAAGRVEQRQLPGGDDAAGGADVGTGRAFHSGIGLGGLAADDGHGHRAVGAVAAHNGLRAGLGGIVQAGPDADAAHGGHVHRADCTAFRLADVGLLAGADDGVHYVHGQFRALHVHLGAGDEGVGHGFAGEKDAHRAAGGHAARAALDGRFGHGARVGIGHVGARVQQAHALARLAGHRLGPGVVGVGDGDGGGGDGSVFRHIDVGGEGAVRPGDDHVHAQREQLHAGARVRRAGAGQAVCGGDDRKGRAGGDLHGIHESLVDTAVQRHCRVAAGGGEAHAHAAALDVVGQQGARTLAVGGVQPRVHGDGRVFHFHALNVGQVLGVQQGHQHVGGDLDGGEAGHGGHAVGAGGGDALAGDGERARAKQARAGDGGCAAAVGVGHAHVHLQRGAAQVRAAGAGGQGRHGAGGVAGGDGHAARRHAAARRDVQDGREFALGIGRVHDDRGGDGPGALVEALGQHVGGAAGEHVRLAGKGQAEGRGHGLGEGPAIGRGHVDHGGDGPAAAGDEAGKDGCVLLAGVHILGGSCHDVAAGQFVKVHILHVVEAFVQPAAGSQTAGGDVAAVHIRLLLGPQQRHGGRTQHADGAGVHAPDLGVGGGLAEGADGQRAGDVQQMAARLLAAQDAGDVFGVVVRHGGVEAHGHSARSGGKSQRLGAGCVLIVLPPGEDIQVREVHLHAGHVHLGDVPGLQQHGADHHAHRHRAAGEAGHIGPAAGVECAVDGHAAGVHVDPVKAREQVCGVEHQQHLRSDAHRAAGDVGGVAFGGGVHVVLNGDAARVDCAGGRELIRVRCRADVGAHGGGGFGHGHRRAHGHSAAGHAEGEGLGVAVHQCVQGDVRCADAAAGGHALGDEGLHQALVDGHRRARVHPHAAGGDARRGAEGGVVHRGGDADVGHVLQGAGAADGGPGVAVKDDGRRAGGNAHGAAAQAQGGSHDVLVIADGAQGKGVRPGHAAQQVGGDPAAQMHHGQGHARAGGTRHTAAHRKGVDGQVGQIKFFALVVQVVDVFLVGFREVAAGEQRAFGDGFDGDIALGGEDGALPCPGFHRAVEDGRGHAHARAHRAGGPQGHGAETCVQPVGGPHGDVARAGDGGACADEGTGEGGAGHVLEAFVDLVGFVRVGTAAAHRGNGEVRAGLAGGHGAVGVLGHRVILVEIFAHVLVRAVVPIVHRHVAVAVAAARQGLAQPGGVVPVVDPLRPGGGLFFHAGQQVVGMEVLGEGGGGVVVQLAAHHQRHDDRADAGGGTAGHAARIGADIALAEGVHQHVAGEGLHRVVRADARGHLVVGQGDDGGDARAGGSPRAGGGRDPDELVVVQRVQGDGAGPDKRLGAVCVVLHDGQDGVLVEDDVHGAGNARGAAAGDARAVGGDELFGIGQDVQLALGVHAGTRQQHSLGEALEAGDHRRAGNAGGGGCGHAESHVVKVDEGVGGDVHIAAGGDLPAQMGLDGVFKQQDVARPARGHGAAGHAEGGGQQEHLVDAVGIHSDGLFGVHFAAAAVQNGKDLLFKEDGNHRAAQGRGGAAGGGNGSAEVHNKGVVLCFNEYLAFSVRVVGLAVAVHVLLFGAVKARADPAVIAHMGVHDVLHQQGVGHAHQVRGGRAGHRTGHRRHINLFRGMGMDHHAPPPVLTVGRLDARVRAGVQGVSGEIAVFARQGLHDVLEDDGGGAAAQSRGGAAGAGHRARAADHQVVGVGQDADAVPGFRPGVVAQAGDRLAGELVVDIGSRQVQGGAAGGGQGRARGQRAVIGLGFHQHLALAGDEGGALAGDGAVLTDARAGVGFLAKLLHQHGGARRGSAAAGGGKAHESRQQVAFVEGVEQHVAGKGFQMGAAARQGHRLGGGGKIRQGGRRVRGAGGRAGGGGQNLHHPVRAVGGEGHGISLDHGVVAHPGAGLVVDVGPGHGAARRHVGAAGGKAHVGGDEGQFEIVVGVHGKAAGGVDGDAVTHRGQRRGAALHQVEAAAQSEQGGTGDRVGGGHVPQDVFGKGGNGHVARRVDGAARLAAAHLGLGLVVQLRQGHHGPHARLGGTQAGGTGDDPAFGGGIRPHSQVSAQGEGGVVADGGQHAVLGQQLGHGARHVGRACHAMVQAAGNGLHIVVHGGQIVDHIQHVQQIVGAEGALHLDLADVGQVVGQGDVHEALVGLAHGGVLVGNGEQVAPVEGELVHALVHQGPVCGDGEAVCLGGEVITHLSVDVAERMQHGKGRANAHRLRADVGAQGADGQLAQVLGGDAHVAPGVDGHVVAHQGQGVGFVGEHGHRAGHAQRALHAGGDGGRHGLGAHVAGVVAGEVLGGVGGDGNFLCRVQGHAACHIGLGCVLIEGHGHGGRHGVGPCGRGGHGGAGGPVAEVDHVFGLGLHVARLRGDIAQDACQGVVLGEGQGDGRRHVEAGGLGLHARHLRAGTGHGSVQTTGLGGGLGQVQPEGLEQIGGIGHRVQLAADAAAGLVRLFLQLHRAHLVGSRHDLVADGAGLGGAGADVVQPLAELLQQAVQVRADGGGHGVALVGDVGGAVHPHAAGSGGVRFQRGGNVAVHQAHAHRRAHGGPAARREGRHAGVAVAAVKGLHQHVGHGEDVLALGVLPGDDGGLEGVHRVGGREAAAGEQRRLDDVVHHRHGHARVKGDALGVGAAGGGLGQLLVGGGAQGGNVLKGFVPPGDGVAARHGDGVHIVAEVGQNGQGCRADDPVAQGGDGVAGGGLGADHGGDHGVDEVGGEGSAHAHRAAGLAGGGCLGGHAQRFVGAGGGGGVDLLGLVGLHADVAAGGDVRLGGAGVPPGDGGAGHGVDDGDGGGTRHAHAGSAHAGNGLGGDGVTHAVQLAAGGEFGGEKGGKGLVEVVHREAQLGHFSADLIQHRHLQAVAVAQVGHPVALFAHHGKDVLDVGRQRVGIKFGVLAGGVGVAGEAGLDLFGQDGLVFLGRLDPLGLLFLFGGAGDAQQFVHRLLLLFGEGGAAALGQLEQNGHEFIAQHPLFGGVGHHGLQFTYQVRGEGLIAPLRAVFRIGILRAGVACDHLRDDILLQAIDVVHGQFGVIVRLVGGENEFFQKFGEGALARAVHHHVAHLDPVFLFQVLLPQGDGDHLFDGFGQGLLILVGEVLFILQGQEDVLGAGLEGIVAHRAQQFFQMTGLEHIVHQQIVGFVQQVGLGLLVNFGSHGDVAAGGQFALAHLGDVLVVHHVHSHRRAHAHIAVGGAGVGGDLGVGVVAGDDGDVLAGGRVHIGDEGTGEVGLQVHGDGRRHLDAAFHGLKGAASGSGLFHRRGVDVFGVDAARQGLAVVQFLVGGLVRLA